MLVWQKGSHRGQAGGSQQAVAVRGGKFPLCLPCALDPAQAGV